MDPSTTSTSQEQPDNKGDSDSNGDGYPIPSGEGVSGDTGPPGSDGKPSLLVLGPISDANVFITLETGDLIRCSEDFAKKKLPIWLEEKLSNKNLSQGIATMVKTLLSLNLTPSPSGLFTEELQKSVDAKLQNILIHIDLEDLDIDSDLLKKLLQCEEAGKRDLILSIKDHHQMSEILKEPWLESYKGPFDIGRDLEDWACLDSTSTLANSYVLALTKTSNQMKTSDIVDVFKRVDILQHMHIFGLDSWTLTENKLLEVIKALVVGYGSYVKNSLFKSIRLELLSNKALCDPVFEGIVDINPIMRQRLLNPLPNGIPSKTSRSIHSSSSDYLIVSLNSSCPPGYQPIVNLKNLKKIMALCRDHIKAFGFIMGVGTDKKDDGDGYLLGIGVSEVICESGGSDYLLIKNGPKFTIKNTTRCCQICCITNPSLCVYVKCA